jgi:hypothetical protein
LLQYARGDSNLKLIASYYHSANTTIAAFEQFLRPIDIASSPSVSFHFEFEFNFLDFLALAALCWVLWVEVHSGELKLRTFDLIRKKPDI